MRQYGTEDLPKLSTWRAGEKIELTVVGPDNPLALGIVDWFQKNGLREFGAKPEGNTAEILQGVLPKLHGEIRHPHSKWVLSKIQELLEGMDISLHALCDGKTAKLFPAAQDHKRALDGDRGLNTGGDGTDSPMRFL